MLARSASGTAWSTLQQFALQQVADLLDGTAVGLVDEQVQPASPVVIAAHRVIKAQDVRSRTQPPGRVPQPGHGPGQHGGDHIGVELPGELTPVRDMVIHPAS
jgi:hypothetical protein